MLLVDKYIKARSFNFKPISVILKYKNTILITLNIEQTAL